MDDLQAAVDKVEPEDELGEEVEAAAGDEPEEADEEARGWVPPACCLVQPVSGPAPQEGLGRGHAVGENIGQRARRARRHTSEARCSLLGFGASRMQLLQRMPTASRAYSIIHPENRRFANGSMSEMWILSALRRAFRDRTAYGAHNEPLRLLYVLYLSFGLDVLPGVDDHLTCLSEHHPLLEELAAGEPVTTRVVRGRAVLDISYPAMIEELRGTERLLAAGARESDMADGVVTDALGALPVDWPKVLKFANNMDQQELVDIVHTHAEEAGCFFGRVAAASNESGLAYSRVQEDLLGTRSDHDTYAKQISAALAAAQANGETLCVHWLDANDIRCNLSFVPCAEDFSIGAAGGPRWYLLRQMPRLFLTEFYTRQNPELDGRMAEQLDDTECARYARLVCEAMRRYFLDGIIVAYGTTLTLETAQGELIGLKHKVERVQRAAFDEEEHQLALTLARMEYEEQVLQPLRARSLRLETLFQFSTWNQLATWSGLGAETVLAVPLESAAAPSTPSLSPPTPPLAAAPSAPDLQLSELIWTPDGDDEGLLQAALDLASQEVAEQEEEAWAAKVEASAERKVEKQQQEQQKLQQEQQKLQQLLLQQQHWLQQQQQQQQAPAPAAQVAIRLTREHVTLPDKLPVKEARALAAHLRVPAFRVTLGNLNEHLRDGWPRSVTDGGVISFPAIILHVPLPVKNKYIIR